jgi:hypothetical protein
VLHSAPPYGLVLVEHADQLRLATAPDVGQLVEAFIDAPPPEPLSQAALEVLAIVAYEQPVARSDVERIRGVDSSGVIDPLLARALIVDDSRLWWPRPTGVSGDHRALLANDGYCVAERTAAATSLRKLVIVACLPEGQSCQRRRASSTNYVLPLDGGSDLVENDAFRMQSASMISPVIPTDFRCELV